MKRLFSLLKCAWSNWINGNPQINHPVTDGLQPPKPAHDLQPARAKRKARATLTDFAHEVFHSPTETITRWDLWHRLNKARPLANTDVRIIDLIEKGIVVEREDGYFVCPTAPDKNS